MSATCARCGTDEVEIHVTAYGVDHHPEVYDDTIIVDPITIEDPDTITVEAVCKGCKHVRYVNQHEWEWA